MFEDQPADLSGCGPQAPRSYVAPSVVISASKIHDLGMFASSAIASGEIVCIKGGHVVRKDALYSTDSIGSYLPLDDQFYLGATNPTEEEGIKLYLNHSCEPNCAIRGEITFVAVDSIGKGEELTIDYATIDNEDYEFSCNCGSSACRRTVSGFDWKMESLQRKYVGRFARYLTEKIETG